eukprot:COSAG02_NODE_13292_length_1414_cov_1.444867_2_plen_32_part_01
MPGGDLKQLRYVALATPFAAPTMSLIESTIYF